MRGSLLLFYSCVLIIFNQNHKIPLLFRHLFYTGRVTTKDMRNALEPKLPLLFRHLFNTGRDTTKVNRNALEPISIYILSTLEASWNFLTVQWPSFQNPTIELIHNKVPHLNFGVLGFLGVRKLVYLVLCVTQV